MNILSTSYVQLYRTLGDGKEDVAILSFICYKYQPLEVQKVKGEVSKYLRRFKIAI